MNPGSSPDAFSLFSSVVLCNILSGNRLPIYVDVFFKIWVAICVTFHLLALK